MKTVKTTTQLLSEARQLEDDSRLSEAAAAYQQLVDVDPADQKAVTRLLTLYRRLKEPRKELIVIEAVLAAYAQRDKTLQEKWVSAHPQAARTGRAFLRSLGGSSVSAFGSNPVVGRLLKRKEVVEKKLHGKGKTKSPKKAPAAKKAAAAAAKAKRVEERKQAGEQKRKVAKQRKLAAQEKRQAAAEKRQQAADKRKQAAEKRKQAAEALPSLFVITLRYLVPLEKIDATMPKHVAFLKKHFAAGDFLVAGRQIPRTGGIIIARGKNRTAIERIMRQDPFQKNKLASVDIVEFTPRPYSLADNFGFVR